MRRPSRHARRLRPRGPGPGGPGEPGRRWRPTEPCEGTTGCTRAVEHGDEQVEGLGPDAAEALGEDVRPQQHQAAGLRLAQGLAHAGGVAADEVELQLAQAVVGDVDVGEAPEAGGHAVDHAARRPPRRRRPCARPRPGRAPRRRWRWLAAQRHGLETVEGQARAVEDEVRSVRSAGHGVVDGRAPESSTRLRPCRPGFSGTVSSSLRRHGPPVCADAVFDPERTCPTS